MVYVAQTWLVLKFRILFPYRCIRKDDILVREAYVGSKNIRKDDILVRKTYVGSKNIGKDDILVREAYVSSKKVLSFVYVTQTSDIVQAQEPFSEVFKSTIPWIWKKEKVTKKTQVERAFQFSTRRDHYLYQPIFRCYNKMEQTRSFNNRPSL